MGKQFMDMILGMSITNDTRHLQELFVIWSVANYCLQPSQLSGHLLTYV
jgi:hypothetical protein